MCARSKIHGFNFMDPLEWYGTEHYPHFENTTWLFMNKEKTVMGAKTYFQPPQNVYEFELRFIAAFEKYFRFCLKQKMPSTK
jgi:hypothetical protein